MHRLQSSLMFGLFRKKTKKKTLPNLQDLEHNPLQEGDLVESLRYDLGECRLILIEGQYYYESLESGKQVSWLRMIDASTERQKVRKKS